MIGELRTARTVPRKAWVAVAGIVAIGAAVGLGSRWGRHGEGFIAQPDSCFVAFAPGQRLVLHKPGTPLEHLLLTDVDGFRVPDAPPGPPARCAALFVGDSFNEGMYVPAEKSFPAVVERLLAAKGASLRAHNGGVRGHTIAEERIQALGRYGARKFEVVVIAQTANDLEDLARLDAMACGVDAEPAATFVAGGDAPDKIVAFKREASRLGRLPQLTGEACVRAAEHYVRLAEDTVRRLSSKGSAVFFASLEAPWCSPADVRWIEGTLMPKLATAVSAASGTYLDARAALRPEDARLVPHDQHPSERGHAAIAAVLAEAIGKSPILQGCR